jgi:5-methylcytosine-specific restriction endonuclease McrA
MISGYMSTGPQECLFRDDPDVMADLHEIELRQQEKREYEEARKAAWYAGTPFPEDELKWRAFTDDYPQGRERERLQSEYREWYAEHSEWKKYYVQARRADELGRKIGRRDTILRVYARARAALVLYCHWCKRLTPADEREVDHILPLTKGGDHVAGNLCICCWSCNQAKSDRVPEEFREYIKATRNRNLTIRRRGLERQLQLAFLAAPSTRRKPPRKATQLTLVRLRA